MKTITCKKCGFTYGSGIMIKNATNVTINGLHTICPRCNTPNSDSFGTNDYDGDGNIIKQFFDNARLTKKELTQLKMLLESVSVDSPRTVDELTVEVEQITPKLKGLFKITQVTNDNIIGIINIILIIIFGILSLNDDSSKSVTNNNTTINNNYNVYDESFSKDFEKKQRLKNLENIKNKKTTKRKPLNGG